MAYRNGRSRYRSEVEAEAASRSIALSDLSQDLDGRKAIVFLEWKKGDAIAAATVPQINSSIPELYPGFDKITEVFDVPDTFLEERLHHGAYSFGSARQGHLQRIWSHFLLKYIGTVDFLDADYESSLWSKSSFLLSWDTRTGFSSLDDSASSPTASGLQMAQVTLICFGAFQDLKHQFDSLRFSNSWEVVLQDPHLLLTYIYDSWYKRVDKTVWFANGRGRGIEEASHSVSVIPKSKKADMNQQAVRETSDKVLTKEESKVNLEHLYRITQTVIYLREGLDATIASLSLAAEHCRKSPRQKDSHLLRDNVLSQLQYRREMLRSTRLRLISLHERLKNINEISYHLVARRDSYAAQRISEHMKKESSRMAVIAFIGILFLPTSLVASVFGAVHDQNYTMQKAFAKFGYLVGAAVPLTLLTVFLYRLFGETESRPMAERSDNGRNEGFELRSFRRRMWGRRTVSHMAEDGDFL
ncbi:hypothetical protein PV08_05040 [Exophiala spinifera]|uniref:Uncharacterized protein n=1 Tax=Exophiala spinifera TaxID=91928 RepID=A0A0D2BGU2_9EURO|nr:uncharacterized protein PV08_05040 [Exophiala spinifera]KIW17845.1 hypothetical protein PV08_05040 [Exophiala spinifera]